MVNYRTRFIRQDQAVELINLWHTAKVLYNSDYDRRLYASKHFALAHPEVSSTAAYKDLEGLLAP